MSKIFFDVADHDDNISDLVGYQDILVHMIFDVKLGENFQRKARFVEDGHETDNPSSVNYNTVVSRDWVIM